MKTLFFVLTLMNSTMAFSRSADYQCRVRFYRVDLTLTQDTSTSMWFSDHFEVLALGYAGSVESVEAQTVYHFYPQMGPIDITLQTQDTVDLPVKLSGRFEVNAPFFVLRDKLDCIRKD